MNIHSYAGKFVSSNVFRFASYNEPKLRLFHPKITKIRRFQNKDPSRESKVVTVH